MNRYCFDTFLKAFSSIVGPYSVLLLLLLASTVPVFLSGCDLPGAKPPVEEGTEEDEEAEGEDAEESEDGEAEGEEGETKKPTPPPPPPVETHLRYTLAEDYHPTRLSWTTEDGFVLQGDLYSPYGEVQALKAKPPVEAAPPAEGEEGEDVAEEEAPEEEASAEEGEGEGEEGEASATPKAPPARPVPSYRYPLVVLTHRLSSSGKRLQFLVPDLVKAGYAVLLLDVRGHGISEGLAYGGVKSWRIFDPPDWTHMAQDFKQVEHYFKHPELDLEKFPLEVVPQKMAIIAEGISANALLVRSAEKDVHLKAVVSLGATLESKKISPILSVMNSRVPILYIASQSEEMSYADSQKLFRITDAVKSLSLYPDKGAGVDILLNDAKARQTATAWIRRYMPPAFVDPAFKRALKDASASWAKQEKLNKALGTKRKAST